MAAFPQNPAKFHKLHIVTSMIDSQFKNEMIPITTRVFVLKSKFVNQLTRNLATSSFIQRRFIDQVRLYARGGTGGNGCKSIGCVGGNGGDVVIVCKENASLGKFRSKENRRVTAGHGSNCKVKGRNAIKSGQDLLVKVPPGTIVKTENGNILSDLDDINQSHIAVKGGSGGSAISNNFQGEIGQRKMMLLELKMISDVGMIGFPNAGKSTLLNKVSRAAPEIADYAFTTINPTVGIVQDFSTKSKFSVADLPGLIEDAHLNRGMGHKFLRHAERTSVILLMVDLCGFQLKENYSARDCFETICLLMKELHCYQSEMLTRPMLLALNKTDIAPPDAIEMLKDKMKNATLDDIASICDESSTEIHQKLKTFVSKDYHNVIPISAQQQVGLDILKSKLQNLVREHKLNTDNYDTEFEEERMMM